MHIYAGYKKKKKIYQVFPYLGVLSVYGKGGL